MRVRRRLGASRPSGIDPARSTITLLAVLALVLSACGGGSGDEEGSTAEGDESTSAGDDSGSDDSGSDDSGTSDEDSAPSGVLRVGVGTNVQSFDPHMAAVAQEYYLNPVYDTLIHSTADGDFEPGLAESWEWVDTTTLELTIRPDIAFSDGEPLDAESVVANFERGKATEASPSAAFYANVEAAEAVDDATVRLELERPSTSLLSDLTRLPGMMMSPASFDGDPSTDPVGAGGWTYDAAESRPLSDPASGRVARPPPDGAQRDRADLHRGPHRHVG